jgi:hypothetical protein
MIAGDGAEACKRWDYGDVHLHQKRLKVLPGLVPCLRRIRQCNAYLDQTLISTALGRSSELFKHTVWQWVFHLQRSAGCGDVVGGDRDGIAAVVVVEDRDGAGALHGGRVLHNGEQLGLAVVRHCIRLRGPTPHGGEHARTEVDWDVGARTDDRTERACRGTRCVGRAQRLLDESDRSC